MTELNPPGNTPASAVAQGLPVSARFMTLGLVMVLALLLLAVLGWGSTLKKAAV